MEREKRFKICNYKFDGFGPSNEVVAENLTESEVFGFFENLARNCEQGNIYVDIFWGRSPEDMVADFICNPTVYENGREADEYYVVAE